MRNIAYIFCFLVWLPLSVFAQGVERDYYISAGANTVILDSLSIVSYSFRITDPQGNPLDTLLYALDPVHPRIHLRTPDIWDEDSLRVRYQVWPVDFAAPVFLKDTSLMRPPGPGEDIVVVPVLSSLPEQGLLRFEGLESSGSISRGLSMGNRQDAGLQSEMNLQLSGMLNEDIEILAVISDQNIPFQPDGNTQQIQDFDKVFIELKGYGGSLRAGDFEMEDQAGYFFNMQRKARGGKISWSNAETEHELWGDGVLSTTFSGAISRGKYARNTLQAMEGNQGPYKLRGNDNEGFIIVLAGTESVFLDGVLLERGLENDYVIDYNLAEITFSPTRIINQHSRLIIEFEYAERNYNRSMVYSGSELRYDKVGFRFHAYSEQDHKNQPLFQEISDSRRALMESVGDSVHRAFDWNVDSTGFVSDRLMYRLTDSLGVDSVFVYSTDPERAHYQLGFSFTGSGNYIPANTAANGRVFQWVAPEDGVPQGTYEPVILLVTPKAQQLISFGSDFHLGANTRMDVEYGLSHQDVNLFSDLHGDNNVGQAIHLEVEDVRSYESQGLKNWKFTHNLQYEWKDAHFTTPERYRGIEFERDWNLSGLNFGVPEHLARASVRAEREDGSFAHYSWSGLNLTEVLQAQKNDLNARYVLGKNEWVYNGSLLNTNGLRLSDFYRHKAFYTRDIDFLRAGVVHAFEKNQLYQAAKDALSKESFYSEEWEFSLFQSAHSQNAYRLYYKNRKDYTPTMGEFAEFAHAHEYGAHYRFMQNPAHRFSVMALYREVDYAEGQDTPMPDRALNARADYNTHLMDGAITGNLFYQAASSLERKRDYVYIEVPAGQGVYVWNDYNENGIMELDEFEISPFPEEANFIRVSVLSEDFVNTYSTTLSQTLNLDPGIIWRNEEGWRGMAARFSNRFFYSIDKKNEGRASIENMNPFYAHLPDSVLINLASHFRNSLFFNRTHPVYSLEWSVRQGHNRALLSNGFETRFQTEHRLRLRYNITRRYMLNLQGNVGERGVESAFFVQRNFTIEHWGVEPMFSFQRNARFRLSILAGWDWHENVMSEQGEKLFARKLGLENRISFPSRGNLQWRYQISDMEYPYEQNTALAFEMMQGLRAGVNHLWSINWQQNLNEFLQLSLIYNGRKPPELSAIHTGTVQLRALF